jgi:beta-ureidopropionase
MHNWAEKAVKIAALSGTNILCFQECWPTPFFMCTREKIPWVEFAEPPQTQSALCLSQKQ